MTAKLTFDRGTLELTGLSLEAGGEPQVPVGRGTRVQVGHRLIFPDFGLVHRRDPSRQALLEIVGFWAPVYRAEKLARLREAHIDSLILCIDDKHSVTADELPAGARVVRYRRRIRPEAVLDVLDGG